MTDYQEILFQNVPAAKWHEFYEADLHDFVHDQLAKPKYYGSNATASALEKRIVKYVMYACFEFLFFDTKHLKIYLKQSAKGLQIENR